ncbi:MAG TPA: metalloregulator ArsR/SmtB family transcription factor [Candidatus Baltobacteraceae bacterium]|nr:metalloregulator ArsR/SmtB family transcription factor [Candidatus Baltobacteraceae bacterium]
MQRSRPAFPRRRDEWGEESALFKALSDPYRLSMLATLARSADEVCVCEFTAALPLEQPTVSHHLRILREAGLVTCERRGTWVYYRLGADVRERVERALSRLTPRKAVA